VRRIIGLVLVGLLALAAWGGDGGGDAATTTTSTAGTSGTTRPTDPAAGPAPALPTAGTATCTDESSDTPDFTPGADLIGVDVTATDAGLHVKFRLAGQVPTTGSTLWSVRARPRDGADTQLGARLENGTRRPFVYLFADRIEQDVPADAMVVGTDTVDVDFPTQALGSLEAPFDWRAEATIQAEDVDYCPGGADTTVLDDERLPFTG
jgi:hypothetical protein